jgi:hypothetical protein
MKSKILATALMVGTGLMMTGCVLNVGDHGSGKYGSSEASEQQNRENIGKLILGMDMQQVTLLMGTADINEAFIAKDSAQNIQVLFYRTQWNKGDGKTTKDECTPIVLRDNQLIGWGDAAYNMI